MPSSVWNPVPLRLKVPFDREQKFLAAARVRHMNGNSFSVFSTYAMKRFSLLRKTASSILLYRILFFLLFKVPNQIGHACNGKESHNDVFIVIQIAQNNMPIFAGFVTEIG